MKDILFVGELPPYTVHGASISNKINLGCLSSKFKVHIVQEYYDIKFHGLPTVSKIIDNISLLGRLINVLFSMKFNFFYGVVYLSRFGVIKNLFCVYLFKIYNRKSKIVLHFHRSDFQLFHQGLINVFLFSILCKIVDRFILLSELQRADFLKYKINDFVVLHNTIEYELGFNYKTDFSYKILFLSNFLPEKGVLEAIESVVIFNEKYKKNIRLELYGAIGDSELFKLIKSYESKFDFINCMGQVSGIDKMNIINDADVLLLPSFNEGLPLILLECMSLGKPIIISNVGFIESALGSNYPLYCIPGNSVQISNLIYDFYNKINRLDISSDIYNSYNSSFSNFYHKKQLLRIFDFEN